MSVPLGAPRLLVSVRSAAEAEAALEGGADVIDVKEPARGPLGRADEAVLEQVLRQVAGRRPVSAALGELTLDSRLPGLPGLAYVKWGLAGWPAASPWPQVLRQKMEAADRPAGPQVVLAAYADWPAAAAPPLELVCTLAWQRPGSVLLLDTFTKVLPLTLLSWLPTSRLAALCARCRAARVRVALAGSLGLAHLPALVEARPDWIAVRGAVCAGGRQGAVSAARVRQLAERLAHGR
jgi:uncharacterized protein (UPF0264 family)